jgi:CRP/FNR family transcriptional regulator
MVHIEQCKLFEALSPSELELLWNSARLVNVANGSVIFNEGDVGDGVYLIKSGKVQIFSRVGEEHEKEFATFGVGEILWRDGYNRKQIRSATAKAVEDTELILSSCEAMANVLERSPKVRCVF